MTPPPDFPGYDDPERFAYPSVWLQIGGAVLAVTCLAGYSWLGAVLRGGEFALTFGPAGFGVMVGTFLATIVVHEGVHGLVADALGYEVTYGFAPSLLAAYAAALEQPIARRDNAIVAAAPLVVLSPIGVVLLAVVDGLALIAVFFGLVLNTASAVGDLYLLARLARMPPGTVLYDESIEAMYVYEPASERTGE